MSSFYAFVESADETQPRIYRNTALRFTNVINKATLHTSASCDNWEVSLLHFSSSMDATKINEKDRQISIEVERGNEYMPAVTLRSTIPESAFRYAESLVEVISATVADLSSLST